MYNINLVQRVRVSSKKSLKAVKFFKIISLLMTFAIAGLIAHTVRTLMEIEKVIDQINELKIKIDEIRRLNKIKDSESEWTLNYNKMLAIKDMISNNTKTGLMLREVGLYMPEGDFLCSFILTPDNIIKETVKVNALSAAKNFKDLKYDKNSYIETIKTAYERSSYIGKDPIEINGDPEEIEIKRHKVRVLNVTMPFVTGKK
ncbi:MAG: hypothetical protein LBD46_07120 [Endomicrobium sp.]|jgi:hypothetical protein|nr:hypothetical protein [Endomicrobium sp.]